VRTVPIRRYTFPALLGLLLAAALPVGASLAAKPKHRARFTGHTNRAAVEGFLAPVSFTVSSDGRSLSSFTFGTFGCFGAGGFRPGVNPYTGHSLIDVGKLKVTASGQMSQKATSSYTAQGTKTTTTIAVSGRFSTPKRASGTITFSQSVTGTVTTTCGPAKETFTASAR
jgi:hypothetical protein